MVTLEIWGSALGRFVLGFGVPKWAGLFRSLVSLCGCGWPEDSGF